MEFDVAKEVGAIAEKHKDPKTLEAKQAELRERLEFDSKVWGVLGDEDPDAAGKTAIIDNNKRIEELDNAVKEAAALGQMRSKNDSRRAALNEPANRLGPGGGNGQLGKSNFRSIADQVLEDPEFKSWLGKIAPNGSNPSRAAFGQSPSVSIGSDGAKALVTGASDTSGGALVSVDRLSIVEAGTAQRPIAILDIITTGSTGSDMVEYVRQGTLTNNAAPVAEATATAGSSGVKPESGFVLSIIQETVKTIAHWLPATRRALSDAPQLRTLINQILIYGLREELADQILTGTGGDGFTGVLETSGTTAQAWDTDLLTTTRKARTKVRTTGRATPTAYVLNPADWERLDLEMDGEDRYYFGGPMQMGTPRLWGLPVVEEEGMTSGVGVVADWKLAVLWNRELANILVSDSHSDFFIRNLIAILAELRAAFGILRPAAFVEMDLTV